MTRNPGLISSMEDENPVTENNMSSSFWDILDYAWSERSWPNQLWERETLNKICPDDNVRQKMKYFCHMLLQTYACVREVCLNESQDEFTTCAREMAACIIALRIFVEHQCDRTHNEFGAKFTVWLDAVLAALKELSAHLMCLL